MAVAVSTSSPSPPERLLLAEAPEPLAEADAMRWSLPSPPSSEFEASLGSDPELRSTVILAVAVRRSSPVPPRSLSE
jgi:hypothetical protein